MADGTQTPGTGTYEVIEDSGVTNVEVTFSGVSPDSGVTLYSFWYCTLGVDGTVLKGWIEADTESISPDGKPTIKRQKLGGWWVFGTRVSDEGLDGLGPGAAGGTPEHGGPVGVSDEEG